MDQSMNFSGMPMDNFAFNGVSTTNEAIPSTVEHRSVLVSRKFINGLVTNYNKTKDGLNSDFEAPKFEVPSFEVPKFDFSAEQVTVPEETVNVEVPNVEVPKFEYSQPVVEPVAPTVEMPKFDFSPEVTAPVQEVETPSVEITPSLSSSGP